jgi:putative methyltransferase (TIGR04325 family)
MIYSIKNKIEKYVPLPVLNMIKTSFAIGYFGDYTTWEEAKNASMGYDDEVIMVKVRDSLLKVKNGEANYERDSILFDNIEYSWPVLAGLLWIASRNNNALNLIDFGGSLGSTYFQNRNFLNHLLELRWNIVEQKTFVECGKEYFEDRQLKFYYSLDDCIKEKNPDTLLLSSVIQYLEDPFAFIEEIMTKDFEYIIIDRTPFLFGEKNDRLTVQKVPAQIYRTSYPARFFNMSKFLALFSLKYTLVADFTSNDRANIPSVFKGFIFKHRDLN